MAINEHGLKINGLKAASGMTKGLDPYSGLHIQIAYDTETGDLYTTGHVGQSWSQYQDSEVITVCHAYSAMTMQEIANKVRAAVDVHEGRRTWEDIEYEELNSVAV